ncbi:uncharacterized protein [Amphiura filiformis]|uniref:uncharacterized protein isoform X3 n=1 Tax=Amphiura filiformis TaxID=82378 RepID=UPI003B21599B
MNWERSGETNMEDSETCSAYNHDHLIEVPLHHHHQQQQQEDNQKMDFQHGGCRCLGKRYAVVLLAGYTLVMGFIFLSYLYTLDISGSNSKSPSKDIIILRKDSLDGFQAEDGEVLSRNTEGKLLVHISFPEKNKPASVMNHYKSMETGKPFNKKCKKCALISSSGHLRDSKAGNK